MSTVHFIAPRGLPAPLPAGERLLWQGSPGWWPVARGVFRLRVVALYFLALAVWRFGSTLADGFTARAAADYALGLAPIAAAALGLLALLAWGYSRSTVYTLTDRRVVLRFGVALPMSVNLPLRLIRSAALRSYADGSGDIPLTLSEERVSYILMWPLVRPWRFAHPEPTLRAVPQAATVAELLTAALTAVQPDTALHRATAVSTTATARDLRGAAA